MNRFYLPPDRIADGIAHFTENQRKQISNVLRLKAGSVIHIFDGSGYEYEAEIVSGSTAQITTAYQPGTESGVRLTLIQGLPKGDKTDLIVQKCTEIGVSRIIFVNTTRSIPSIKESQIAHRLTRWNAIAMEAAEQCGRVRLPEVTGITPFQHALYSIRGIGIIAWEEERSVRLIDVLPQIAQADEISLIVGPEGGFTPHEFEMAQSAGMISASLGKRILRTETAAIVGSASVIYGIESMRHFGENSL